VLAIMDSLNANGPVSTKPGQLQNRNEVRCRPDADKWLQQCRTSELSPALIMTNWLGARAVLPRVARSPENPLGIPGTRPGWAMPFWPELLAADRNPTRGLGKSAIRTDA
jgi:hypothetical protein